MQALHSSSIREEYAVAITKLQRPLFAYILILVANVSDAEDVLQNTNQSLLKKAEIGGQVDNLLAWSKKVAYFEVLAWRKTRSRDRLVFADDGLIESLASEDDESVDDRRLSALEECRSSLKSRDQLVLRGRYEEGKTASCIGESVGMTETAIRQSLLRIRHRLSQCVKRRLGLLGESQ